MLRCLVSGGPRPRASVGVIVAAGPIASGMHGGRNGPSISRHSVCRPGPSDVGFASSSSSSASFHSDPSIRHGVRVTSSSNGINSSSLSSSCFSGFDSSSQWLPPPRWSVPPYSYWIVAAMLASGMASGWAQADAERQGDEEEEEEEERPRDGDTTDDEGRPPRSVVRVAQRNTAKNIYIRVGQRNTAVDDDAAAATDDGNNNNDNSIHNKQEKKPQRHHHHHHHSAHDKSKKKHTHRPGQHQHQHKHKHKHYRHRLGDDGTRAAATQVITRRQYELGIPGVAVVVLRDGLCVWSDGFGWADVENRVPVTPDTLMRVASISKSLTSIALGRLLEEGRVDLDADVRQYVPAWPDKGHGPITVRHLAGHLGGIRHYHGATGIDSTAAEFLSRHPYKDVTSALKVFEIDPLLHPPGTKFAYTTHGWTLLSAVIEGVAKQPYLQYMQQHVLTPLQLHHTVPDVPERILYQRARGYRRFTRHGLENAPYVDVSAKYAGGGYLSTSRDIARFGQALLDMLARPPGTQSLAELHAGMAATATAVAARKEPAKSNQPANGATAKDVAVAAPATTSSSSSSSSASAPTQTPTAPAASASPANPAATTASSTTVVATAPVVLAPAPASSTPDVTAVAFTPSLLLSAPSTADSLPVVPPLLRSDTVRQLFTSQHTISSCGNDRTNYGIGWKVHHAYDNEDPSLYGVQIVSHSGGAVGASSQLLLIPAHRLVVVLLTNLEAVSLEQTAVQIAKLFIQPPSPTYSSARNVGNKKLLLTPPLP